MLFWPVVVLVVGIVVGLFGAATTVLPYLVTIGAWTPSTLIVVLMLAVTGLAICAVGLRGHPWHLLWAALLAAPLTMAVAPQVRFYGRLLAAPGSLASPHLVNLIELSLIGAVPFVCLAAAGSFRHRRRKLAAGLLVVACAAAIYAIYLIGFDLRRSPLEFLWQQGLALLLVLPTLAAAGLASTWLLPASWLAELPWLQRVPGAARLGERNDGS